MSNEVHKDGEPRMIRGVLIDPVAMKLTDTELQDGVYDATADDGFRPTLKPWYELLHCDCITHEVIDKYDLVLDDEGLFKEEQGFFTLVGLQGDDARWNGYAFAGRCFVCGCDECSFADAPNDTGAWLKSHLRFVPQSMGRKAADAVLERGPVVIELKPGETPAEAMRRAGY